MDIQTSSRELIRQVSYQLGDLVATQLGAKRLDIEQEMIPKLFRFVDVCLLDCSREGEIDRSDSAVLALL